MPQFHVSDAPGGRKRLLGGLGLPVLLLLTLSALFAWLPARAAPARQDGRPAPAPLAPSQGNATSGAPGYCASNGGDTTYERITGAVLTPNGDGTMKLQVNVFISNPEQCVPGQECPTYEASPEHVNAWIDWNGDKVWDASERVMDRALTGYTAINYYGTMTGISQFTMPAVFTDTTWLRANVGYLSDPNDACTLTWTYGNVVDQPVVLQPPKITAITVTGSKDANNPMTTYGVQLQAAVNTPAGFEVTKVSWSGDLKPGDGNPYTYIPDANTQGIKKIVATVTFKNKASGQLGQVSRAHEFKLFFEKKGDDNGDGKPNWFAYWGTDGAVPGLTNALITFDATKSSGSYGAWSSSSDRVELGPAAAETHYPGGLKIDGVTYGNVRGIDSVAEVIAHELRHRTTIKVNWGAGGIWVGKADSDYQVPTNAYYDRLPNEYEDSFGTDKTKTDSKNLAGTKSAVYKYYGDNEFDAIVAGHNQKGVANKDWANPGKQSNPAFTAITAADEASAAAAAAAEQAGLTGGPVTAASQYETPAVVLPGLAQLSGAYTDAGVDGNNDGQLDVLRVTVGVNVVAAGPYQVVGWLATTGGTDLAWAAASANLSEGPHQLALDFDGTLLRLAGQNGPYRLARVEVRTGDHGDVADYADNAYTTAAYAAAGFAAPAVVLTGAYADRAVDANSDGLFDTLEIDAGVTVNRPGSYSLVGWLYAADGTPVPGGVATVTFSATGTQTLRFDGQSIRWSRKDGPYSLRYLEVRDQNQARVAVVAQAYTTSTAFTAAQFARGGAAELVAGGYTGQAIDENGDTLYDLLRITATVNATAAGIYQVAATLADQGGSPIAELTQQFTVTVGSNIVTLDFPGGAIRRHGVDGPFRLAQVIITTPEGDVVDQQRAAFTTQAYPAAAFAPPLVALAGDLHDAAVAGTPGGQPDRIAISIPVVAGNTGVVIAQGRLVDKNGGEIQWAEANVAVTAGVVQTVTLPFSATNILAHGVDGPFVLKNLIIYHTGDPNQALANLPAYVTAGYRAADLSVFIGPATSLALGAAPNQLVADGSSTSEITVIATDAGGNLVPNQLVTFTTTKGQLAPSSGRTDSTGKVTVSLTAPTTAGVANVTASAGSASRAVPVTFVVGPPGVLIAAAGPTTIAADGRSAATVRATVTDALGNPITGQVVTFATTLGAISGSAPTDASGVAAVPLTAPAVPGVAQVTAQVGGLQATATVTFASAESKLYLPLVQRR